jgi:hypothetical protein
MSQQTYELSSDRPAMLGAHADLGPCDVLSGINSSPGAVQVDTVTITNYVDGKTLTWTIDGIAFSYAMTTADADTTGVAHSIVQQVQAEPLFGGKLVATHLLGVITLTGRFPGVGWTIVSTGTWIADFTVANVTATAAGAALPYGRLCLDDGQVTGRSCKKVKLASAANCSARVVSAIPSHEDATRFTASVTVYDRTYEASYDSTAGHTVANICAALKATLNAQLPASTVAVDDPGSAALSFTAEVAGLAFEYSFGADKVGLWTITETTYTKATDVNELAAGIALRSDSIETNSDTVPGYPANRACSIMRQGRVVVQTPSLVVPTKRVFVRMASATTASPLGSFDDDAGAGLVELDPKRFRWIAGLSTTRAVLQVNCD